MRPKSAATLDAKWKSCPWYRKPSGAPGERRHLQDDLNLRLRRALSWLERAEKEYGIEEDLDAAFIFSWMAFNAVYEQFGTSSVYRDKKEDEKRREYVGRIVAIQNSKSEINSIVWSVLRDEIQKMLENRFVYAPYWSHRNNPAKARNWKQRFNRDRKRAAAGALGETNRIRPLRAILPSQHATQSTASRRCDLEGTGQPKSSRARCENHGTAGAQLHRSDDRASECRLGQSALSGGSGGSPLVGMAGCWVIFSARAYRVPTTPSRWSGRREDSRRAKTPLSRMTAPGQSLSYAASVGLSHNSASTGSAEAFRATGSADVSSGRSSCSRASIASDTYCRMDWSRCAAARRTRRRVSRVTSMPVWRGVPRRSYRPFTIHTFASTRRLSPGHAVYSGYKLRVSCGECLFTSDRTGRACTGTVRP